jgi:hypothetical protein
MGEEMTFEKAASIFELIVNFALLVVIIKIVLDVKRK